MPLGVTAATGLARVDLNTTILEGGAIFRATPAQAAAAAAAALAAIQLILRDQGRTPAAKIAGKPIGGVHGDSICVHACDSAGEFGRPAAGVAEAKELLKVS